MKKLINHETGKNSLIQKVIFLYPNICNLRLPTLIIMLQ